MKKGFSVILILVIILAISLIAVGAYYFGTQSKSKTVNPPAAEEEIEQENLVGNDRDEHGCIGSAGYSWCEIKQKCLRIWEEPCEEITSAPSVPVPTVDETETLINIISNALVAKHGNSANQLTITVSKIEGNYASGGASGEGGGGMWFSAKINGSWELVWDGNGVILCDDLVAYPNFPSTMIPECYNQQTNKNVIR